VRCPLGSKIGTIRDVERVPLLCGSYILFVVLRSDDLQLCHKRHWQWQWQWQWLHLIIMSQGFQESLAAISEGNLPFTAVVLYNKSPTAGMLHEREAKNRAAASALTSRQTFIWSRILLSTKCSLPCSQMPALDLNSQAHTTSLRLILLLSSHMSLGLLSILFPSDI
jgi:hypothetical protein